MRHAEGVLRAILLAIIVTFGVTTPVQADLPEEECTEENSGEVACHCHGQWQYNYTCAGGDWDLNQQWNAGSESECEEAPCASA